MPKSYARFVGRFSLFIIYFYFGLLKLIGQSPAGELVKALEQKTLPFIPFHQFFIAFAIFEMFIGVCFLIPKLNKLGYLLFFAHIITTTLPLFLLPQMVWVTIGVPTLEGQYIIKNLALVSVVCLLLATKTKRYSSSSSE